MAKNIVLCSDGTGNSAGKFRGTNVRRIYEAIDRSEPRRRAAKSAKADEAEAPPRQIAYYDDGVGTGGSRLLRTLGGAFGWGLKRNMKDLYTFLVRNYEPDDRIYLFGFSRGAYTVRAVVGMVESAGLLSTHDRDGNPYLESQLNEGVDAAYRVFRGSFGETRLLQLLRLLRLKQPGKAREKLKTFALAIPASDPGIPADEKPCVYSFVGVWDTVDAVGLPSDELAQVLDRVFWRFRFNDLVLCDRVAKGCQAIAIDDARHTFHPVLWDERDEAEADKPEKRRVEQVWFAGMHADVGGGYPEESLSLVSLNWMMDRAAKQDLRFDKELLAEYRTGADPHGLMHNSRSGLASFYRYKPRYAEQLAHAETQGLKTLLVHDSVLRRVHDGRVAYAPTFLQTDTEFDIVAMRKPGGGSMPAEPPGDEIECARDINWWRRVHYSVLMLFIALVVVIGFLPAWFGLDRAEPQWDDFATVFGLLKGVMPAFAERLVDTYAALPILVLLVVATAILLMIANTKLIRMAKQASQIAWFRSSLPESTAVEPTALHTFARKVRMSPLGQRWTKLTAIWAPRFLMLVIAAIVLYVAWLLFFD